MAQTDPTTPQVDPALAAFVQQQAQFNAQVGQTLDKLEKTLPKLAARPAPAPPPVGPADYQKANEAAINEFISDPVGFSGKLVNIATQNALAQARAESEQKLADLEARNYANQIYTSFFGSADNADLRRYQGWIAGEMQQMPGDWPVERKLVEAANFIRNELAQRDDWVSRVRAQGGPNWDASAAGGRPAGNGGILADEEGVPMDETSLHRMLSEDKKAWKAARRNPANHDDYRRRGGR